jgi:hypothetical protein
VQVKPGYLRTVVVVLIASLVLTACSGSGGQGSTWFNLPSIPVNVDANGNASALGFNLGYIGLQPSLIAQLQAANVQALEVRIGHKGVFILANGDPLPYIAWNDASVATLQEVLRNPQMQPMLQNNGSTIASAIPWLRRIGLGAQLRLPAARADLRRWRGEQVVVAPRTAPATTIGPMVLGGLAFDQQGEASLGGISLADLGAGFTLPPDVLQILRALNAQQVTVNTRPTGIELGLNGRPLPGIAYDANSLSRALGLAQPFVAGTPMEGTLANLGPQLVGADIQVAVSFTGEPAGPIQLAAVPLQLQADGTLVAYGIAVTNVGADLVQTLQSADVQQIYLNAQQDTLVVAINGELLPVITWSDRTLDVVRQLAPTLGIDPGMLNGGLAAVQTLLSQSDVGLTVAVAPAESSAPVDVQVQVPDIATLPEPDIQIGAVLDNGQLQSVAGLPVSMLEGLGVAVPALPADVVNILNSLGVAQLQIVNTGNALVIQGDGETLLALTYDEASLQRTLVLVGALTENGELVNTIEGYLPLLTGQTVNVVVSLVGGEAPTTRLANIPVSIQQDGGLMIYGMDLGLGSVLPADIINSLQAANVQRLDLDILDNNLYLAANGQALPVISWDEESFDTVEQMVGVLANVPPATIGAVLELLQTIDVGLQVTLPPGEGAADVQVAEGFDVTQIQLQTPELGDISQPVIQLVLNYENGQLVEAGGIPAEVLQSLGIPSLDLPADLAALFTQQLQTNQVRLIGAPNTMAVSANGDTLLTLHYDAATLEQTLQILEPFLPQQTALFLQDENVMTLLQQNILPVLISANLNVVANLQ